MLQIHFPHGFRMIRTSRFAAILYPRPARRFPLRSGWTRAAGDRGIGPRSAYGSKVVAGRALDAGPLSRAHILEGLTGLIVSLNKRYKGHAGIRVTGLPEA